MTNNTIANVPRELLAELQEHIHCHHDAVLWGKVCDLLSAPSPAGVDGLNRYEVFPYLDDDVAELDICEADDGSFVKYDAAAAIIDGLRGEVVEQEETANQWRELALQFDRHRMAAMAHIRAAASGDKSAIEALGVFAALPPIPGHEITAAHDRYAREHADHMARLAKMTPEQIAEMELSLHNAMAELEALSVTKVMLDIVPGDGDGYEVYAKSVSDVETKLGALSEENEELQFERDKLRAELAAIKAQGVVMPEPMKRGDEGGSGEYGAAMIRGYNACLREVARLNAAPVQQVSAPDGWRLVTTDWLKRIHRDLDACQKLIWANLRGCDPSYYEDAQERLREIDAMLAAALSSGKDSVS